MRNRSLKVIFAAFVALVLAGCTGGGGDGGELDATETATAPATPTGTTTDQAQQPPVELEGEVNVRGTVEASGGSVPMTMGDFYFDPTFVRTEPGTTVTVELTNDGSATHTFTIEDQADVVLDPGASETVEVTLPEGTESLTFICRFHVGQGMKGAFFSGG